MQTPTPPPPPTSPPPPPPFLLQLDDLFVLNHSHLFQKNYDSIVLRNLWYVSDKQKLDLQVALQVTK